MHGDNGEHLTGVRGPGIPIILSLLGDNMIIGVIIAGIFSMILGLALPILFGLVAALVLEPAWNYCMPIIFHLPVITYWQAFALYVVATLLVKGSASATAEKK